MSLALNWLLGFVTLGSALLALASKRPRTVALAVAANTLGVAALCARLSAPLVGIAVALLAGSLLLLAPEPAAGPAPLPSLRPRTPRAWLTTLLAVAGWLLIALALASIFFVGFAPGQTALGASPPAPDGADAHALARTLFERHGLAVLVAALLSVATAVGLRIPGEGR